MRRFILSHLPPGFKQVLRDTRSTLRVMALSLFSRNGFLASLYFAFFSRRFYGEHHAVLKGRLKYYENLAGGGGSSPQLRRNTHRLEKGLIMRPRRPVFAEGFILETVQAFNRARATEGYSAKELKWAKDVLQEYFSVVSDTPAIVEARRTFTGVGDTPTELDDASCKNTPYQRSGSPTAAIEFEDLHTLYLRRRSVRWYLDDEVPAELVGKAIDAAAQAPSACNRQPFRYIVTTESESATRIAECAGGTVGFAQQLPAMIVVVGDLSAYPLERDRHLIYIDASLASMQLMLAAETLGLSTCPINWPDMERSERRIRKLLKLPSYERVIMLIAVGYGDPEGEVAFSQKKQGDVLISEFSSE